MGVVTIAALAGRKPAADGPRSCVGRSSILNFLVCVLRTALKGIVIGSSDERMAPKARRLRGADIYDKEGR